MERSIDGGENLEQWGPVVLAIKNWLNWRDAVLNGWNGCRSVVPYSVECQYLQPQQQNKQPPKKSHTN